MRIDQPPEGPAPTVGIDVGGSKIAGAVVDGSGRIVARRTIPTDPDDTAAIVGGITKVAREMLAAAPSATAVGVGAAALVDVDRGVILTAPNLSWEQLHLRAMLEDRLGVPVIVDNDANVAAWGEAHFGAAAGAHDAVLLTIGTGIGGGLVLGGSLYRGAHWVGGELGHMILDPAGPPCPCGGYGCLESLASGRAIEREMRARLAGGAESKALTLAGGAPDAVTGEHIGEAAAADDAVALAVVAEAGRWLGFGIANLVNIFDPEVVILAGGAAEGLGAMLLEPAREAATERIAGVERRPPVRIEPATLGADAGVVGAAALAAALEA